MSSIHYVLRSPSPSSPPPSTIVIFFPVVPVVCKTFPNGFAWSNIYAVRLLTLTSPLLDNVPPASKGNAFDFDDEVRCVMGRRFVSKSPEDVPMCKKCIARTRQGRPTSGGAADRRWVDLCWVPSACIGPRYKAQNECGSLRSLVRRHTKGNWVDEPGRERHRMVGDAPRVSSRFKGSSRKGQ